MDFRSNGRAEMDDPDRSATGRDWRLILAAILAVALVIGGIAYKYSDDLIAFAQLVTGGKTGRAQGRLHY